MNHEKEYSKTAAAGCEVRRIKALSTEGHLLPESDLFQSTPVIADGRIERAELARQREAQVSIHARHC